MPQIALKTGATLDYLDIGQGVPVIAVHGMLGTGEAHLAGVAAWLSAEGYRVIAPTMRGYGASYPKPRDFPMDFYRRDMQDVIALMDALEIERAHVMGYSDGGEIALFLAGTIPDRVISATCWGAVGYFGESMRDVIRKNIPGSAWLTPADIAPHGIPDADQFVMGWTSAVKYMIDTGGDVSVSVAHNATMPVLLMLGDKDILNPAAYAQRWVDEAPNARLEVLPCGHPVHDEQWEAFKALVLPHLKGAEPR